MESTILRSLRIMNVEQTLWNWVRVYFFNGSFLDFHRPNDPRTPWGLLRSPLDD